MTDTLRQSAAVASATVTPNRRNITIVSETFPPEINGVANTLKHLCQGLTENGHKVTVVRPGQGDEPTGFREGEHAHLCHNEWRTRSLPIPGYSELQFGVITPATLRRLWQQVRPDSIYIATQGPLGLSAVLAARKLGLPVSSGFHTNFHSYSRYYSLGAFEPLLTRYGKWFHNQTSTTLVPTRKMQNIVRNMGITNSSVWSRGVDCQRFSPEKRDQALRQQWGLSNHECAVLYVGRLAAEKNLQLAQKCFEQIRHQNPSARFVLVGDGPLRQRLQAKHRSYIFCGNRQGNDLARHYASGDVFLFPSKTDTFGNVVLEAMASGLAVVAFDDAAAAEHINHMKNGLKIDLSDDQSFIKQSIALAGQRQLIATLGREARSSALKLGWKSQIEQFERLTIPPMKELQNHDIEQ